jgi:hypothetical protein
MVNRDSKRFMDEGRRHLFATFELHAYEVWRNQNQQAYFVTHRVVMDHFRPGWVCVLALFPSTT